MAGLGLDEALRIYAGERGLTLEELYNNEDELANLVYQRWAKWGLPHFKMAVEKAREFYTGILEKLRSTGRDIVVFRLGAMYELRRGRREDIYMATRRLRGVLKPIELIQLFELIYYMGEGIALVGGELYIVKRSWDYKGRLYIRLGRKVSIDELAQEAGGKTAYISTYHMIKSFIESMMRYKG